MFLEWGNGIYFNNKGEYTRTGADDGVVTLIYEFLEPSFTGIDNCPTDFIKKIEKKREMSNGNYDAIFARVANFSWEFTPEGYYLITLKLEKDGIWISFLIYYLARAFTLSYYYPSIRKRIYSSS